MDRKSKNDGIMKFINVYRQHDVLWNPKLSTYFRNDIKTKAYQSIGNKLRMTVPEVKKKIKSLRNTYSAEKNKVERNKKTDPEYATSLFWFNEMTFLDPTIKTRHSKNKTKISTPENEDLVDFDFIQTSDDLSNNVLSPATDFEISETIVEYCKDTTPPFDNTFETTEKINNDEKTLDDISIGSENSMCSIPADLEASEQLVDRCKSEDKPEKASPFDIALNKLVKLNNVEQNVYKIFGNNIASQLKTFPETEAFLLMEKIQSLMSRKKIENLKNATIEDTQESNNTLINPPSSQSSDDEISTVESDDSY